MTLQRQLRDKEFKRWEMDNRPTPQEPATTQTKPPEPSQQDAPEGLHPAAQAFIDRTKWWGDNPKAEQAAIQIEESLLDKGYKRSEELYQEVEKQLKKRYPRLYGIKPNSPVTPDDKSHGDTHNKVTRRPKGYGETKESMSSEHLAIMRKYGLDPNKLKDRRAFVQEAWSGETNT